MTMRDRLAALEARVDDICGRLSSLESAFVLLVARRRDSWRDQKRSQRDRLSGGQEADCPADKVHDVRRTNDQMSGGQSGGQMTKCPADSPADKCAERKVPLDPSKELITFPSAVFDISSKTPEEILREALSLLVPLAYVNAGSFHRGVEAALLALGCEVLREFSVPHHGTRIGRIDLVVTGPVRFAVELDDKISRGGSLKKLAEFDGERFILLRDGPRILRPEDAISDRCVVPEWVPQRQWADYLAMRQRIRRPMTERAKVLAIGILAHLRAAGQPPERVLEQSVFNSWQGLFELRSEAKNGANFNGGSRAMERENRNRRNIAAAAELAARRLAAGGAFDAGAGGRGLGSGDDGAAVRRLSAAAGGDAGGGDHGRA